MLLLGKLYAKLNLLPSGITINVSAQKTATPFASGHNWLSASRCQSSALEPGK